MEVLYVLIGLSIFVLAFGMGILLLVGIACLIFPPINWLYCSVKRWISERRAVGAIRDVWERAWEKITDFYSWWFKKWGCGDPD